MRWKKYHKYSLPLGNITRKRYKKEFLWKPLIINGYWIFFENAMWEEGLINGIWVPLRWVESSE